MEGLRISDTNSTNDSKGRAFGLEGNDFVYVVVGFVAALGFYLLLSVMFGCGKIASCSLALPVVVGPTWWILFLKHNRPEGYAEDWFDQTFGGEGWSFVAHNQIASPVLSKYDSRS